MAFEQKELSGALFKNKRRTQSNHPEYTGQTKINGIEYWISAWIKEKSNGEKYFSIAYKVKDDQKNIINNNDDNGYNDDIPF